MLSSDSQKENGHSQEDSKKRNVVRSNEMVPPIIAKDKGYGVSEQSGKGGSLLKDLMLIPSYNDKKKTDEFEFNEVDNKEEVAYSPNFGGEGAITLNTNFMGN